MSVPPFVPCQGVRASGQTMTLVLFFIAEQKLIAAEYLS